jgi:hypothetical protein
MKTIKGFLTYYKLHLKKASVILTIILMCGLLLIGQQNSFATFDDPTSTCAGVTDVPESECQALLTLYNSTSGDNWTDNSNW